jgi:myo-inositol-1(or 4)-monophosphatase
MCVVEQVSRFFDEVVAEFDNTGLGRVLSLRNKRTSKPDGSYVTEGDLLVQEFVFAAVRRNFDQYNLVSEEEPFTSEAAGDGICIVIDPIDGTENFTSGLPEWGVSISCYQSRKHIGSLIGTPEMNYWLRSGSTLERFSSRIHGLSSSLTKEQILEAAAGYEYRVLGCCVYNMINVIRGSFIVFQNPRGANSWDILGGLNLALEHGLKVEVEGKQYAGEYLPPTCKYRFKIEQR